MNRRRIAAEYFSSGYNCCQAVALAFLEDTGLSETQLVKLASGFGGGMAGLREVCGAVTGMFLAYDLIDGNPDPKDSATKAAQNDKLRAMAGEFEERNGSILCGALLSAGVENKKQSREYHSTSPCGRYVEDATEILEKYLTE